MLKTPCKPPWTPLVVLVCVVVLQQGKQHLKAVVVALQTSPTAFWADLQGGELHNSNTRASGACRLCLAVLQEQLPPSNAVPLLELCWTDMTATPAMLGLLYGSSNGECG